MYRFRGLSLCLGLYLAALAPSQLEAANCCFGADPMMAGFCLSPSFPDGGDGACLASQHCCFTINGNGGQDASCYAIATACPTPR